MIGMSVFVFLHLVRLFHFLMIGFPVLAVKSSLWSLGTLQSRKQFNSSPSQTSEVVRSPFDSLEGTANDHITYYTYSP